MRNVLRSRWYTLLTTVSAIAMLGAVFWWLEDAPRNDGAANPHAGQPTARKDVHAEVIARRFRQGVLMLHARQYEHAAVAFQRVLDLEPRLPEARVNMGFAMLGLGRADLAEDFFRAAVDLRPTQRNAYYGLAESLDTLGDRPGAIGAMRTFVHLSPADDPFMRKARSALWEWQPDRDRTVARRDRLRGEELP